jgi:FKBP-type peptidyl-prolyl cis-trans isomerase FkpA
MTHKLKLLTGLLLICMACSNEKETASGQKFTVLKKGDGVKLDSGKYLILSMIYKDGKDSIWNDTRKNGVPVIIQNQMPVPQGDGVLEAVMMMTKGDSITFKVAAKSLFQNTFRSPLPPYVDSASLFTFNLGLTDVLGAEDFQKFQEKMVAKQNEDFAKQQEKQLAIDNEIIENHLKEKGVNALKTESGLRYVITKAGKGENAKAGQSATVAYSGYLLNGTVFDSGSYTFVIETRQVIAGWDVAAQLMNKGSKMTVYIPSGLAYGPQRRDENIVENSILAFDMEMVDIK